MSSKSVVARRVAAARPQTHLISVPDPKAWQAILRTHAERVRKLEEMFAEEILFPGEKRLPPPSVVRARIDEAIALHQEDPEGSGEAWDDRELRLIVALIRARTQWHRAEREARQGRLFPAGKRQEGWGSTLLDPADVMRRDAAYQAHVAAQKIRAEVEAREAERQSRARDMDRRRASEVVEGAIRAEILVPVGKREYGFMDSKRRLYQWEGESHTEEGWKQILLDDDRRRDALMYASREVFRERDRKREEESKKAESERRKAKAADARRPLPKGYTVGKGRRGYYYFTTPKGETYPAGGYGLKNKGEAVVAAIEHAAGNPRYKRS
jgi:hypothetical protein